MNEEGKPIRDLDPTYPGKDKILQQLETQTKEW
jgi:hypothetical protein